MPARLHLAGFSAHHQRNTIQASSTNIDHVQGYVHKLRDLRFSEFSEWTNEIFSPKVTFQTQSLALDCNTTRGAAKSES